MMIKRLSVSVALMIAFTVGGSAATVEISAEIVPNVSPPGVFDSDTFDSLDSTYTISTGDTVKFNYRVESGSSSRFEVHSGNGIFAPWVEKVSAGGFTISDVTLELQGFSTSSSWDGTATMASQTDGSHHLGPLFQYSDFGLLKDDTFSFTNILVSFKVDSVSPTPFTTSRTRTRFSNVSISSIETSPVPLPAAGWMLIVGVGGFFAVRRRGQRQLLSL